MKNRNFQRFFLKEDGAVTVDWVLITAAIALAGAVGMATVESKVSTKSQSVTL